MGFAGSGALALFLAGADFFFGVAADEYDTVEALARRSCSSVGTSSYIVLNIWTLSFQRLRLPSIARM